MVICRRIHIEKLNFSCPARFFRINTIFIEYGIFGAKEIEWIWIKKKNLNEIEARQEY